MSGNGGSIENALVMWEGDSREVLQSFPDGVRQNIGFQLWQLQKGERPSDYRPLQSIGSGVFEVRDQGTRGWDRLPFIFREWKEGPLVCCFLKKRGAMSRGGVA